MERHATAVWQGSLKEGIGTLATQSGVLSDTKYSFRMRFEDERGTNPEELIAAAHAGCFAMQFSAMLGAAGITPTTITATSNITMEPVDGKQTVTKSHLSVVAEVPDAPESKVVEIANEAKATCPISRLLKAEITLSLTVV